MMNFLRIEAVGFILIRPDGKILMQLRDAGRSQKILYPNMWSIPGGGKEQNESHLDCVVREVKEEYDLDIRKEDCHLLFAYEHDGNVTDWIFVCPVPKDAKPKLMEGADMKWMTMEEIKKLNLAWELNSVLPKIEDKLKLKEWSK